MRSLFLFRGGRVFRCDFPMPVWLERQLVLWLVGHKTGRAEWRGFLHGCELRLDQLLEQEAAWSPED